jgi:sensor histidine kinase YesM
MFESLRKIFSNRFVIVFSHFAAWALVLSLPFFFNWQKPPFMKDEMPQLPPIPPMIPNFEHLLWITTVSNMVLILLFYLNYYVFIPKILYRKSISYYIFALIGCLIVFWGLRNLIQNFIARNDPFFFPFFAIFIPVAFILALSLALRVTSDRLREERERKEQETENLKSELSFLRSQISPHFLFNIMNNLVALNRKKSDLVEPTLIKLSQLMRYMLYDSDEKKVSIDREIEYLESYIDLQKLRFSKDFNIVFEKNVTDAEGGQIEPMLLIPFVENAFKHGTGSVENPKIHIQLVYNNKILIFNVFNKFDPLSMETKDSSSGIGLRNVSRRLTLLYGNNHSLKVAPEGNMFKVELTITIPN